MTPPTLSCAQALRDGGIDAMAALDSALALALAQAPAESHADLKQAIGRAMSAIMGETINPSVKAFAALAPTEDEWRRVVQARLQARVAAAAAAAGAAGG